MQIIGSIDKSVLISGKTGVNQLSGLFGAGYKEPNFFTFTVTVTAGQTVNLQLSVHTGKIAKVQWGDGKETTVSYSGNRYISHTNIYTVAGTYTIKIADSDNLNQFRIYNPDYSVDIVGALPVNLTYISFYGDSINWNHTGALPVNLTYIYFRGDSINWSYSGALPVELTYIYFYGNSINWNHTGALPVNLTSILFSGNSINWSYSGALPVNLTYIYFNGNSINWSYSAQAYKSTLTYFRYLPGVTGKWSSVMVDQVIKDLAASTMAGSVNIAGNNEARTSASDQDLIDLRANGATVTVNEYIPFSFTVTVAAGETVDLGLSVHTGKTAKVQWGDGKETTVSYSAGDYTSHTNVYTAAGTYNIKIVDADNLKGFRIVSPIYSVNIVGVLPVNLTTLWLYGNTIAWTYTSQSYKSTLSYFLYLPGTTGKWLSASVDQVIADLKTSTMAGTVIIAGNNEARTSASDHDLVDLRANGATVTVNEY